MIPIRSQGAFLIILAAAVLWNCDTNTVGPGGNRAPETTLSGGPEPNDAVSYRAELHWTGTDPDGFVVYFEYAVDDTSDWVRVVGGDAEFLFSCGEEIVFDTLTAASGADSLVERSTAFHTFWVRAVDNEGERDPSPAWICFNATTVFPRTRITHGPSTVSGNSVRIRWEGTDPDGTTGRPVEYEYFHAIKSVMRESYGYEDGAGVTRQVWNALDWIRVDGDCTRVDLRNLPTGYGEDGGKRSMFFVRAVDEAGAVEQTPEQNRNWIEWGVGGLAPQILIRSGFMGTAGMTLDHVGTAFAGSRVRFAWAIDGDLDPWALDLLGFRHAYDAPIWTPSSGYDPDLVFFPPGGETFTLDETGRHVFLVEAGFLPEGSSEGEFAVDVHPAPPSATSIFHLNDFYVPGYPGQYPDPNRYVAFWADTLLASFDQEASWTPRLEGDNDPPVTRMSEASTIVLTLDDWEFGDTQIAVWNQLNVNPIWSYVDAGGNLLIAGFLPAWSFLPDRDMDLSGPEPVDDPCYDVSNYGACGGYLVWHQPHYPDSSIAEYSPFPHPLHEFCALETTWLDPAVDLLTRAEALYTGLPDLVPDTTRSSLIGDWGGLRSCEELTARGDAGVVPLYAPVRGEGGVAAARPGAIWIPSDGHRGHVVYMSMPLWFFPPGDAREAVETILEDLFGETRRAP